MRTFSALALLLACAPSEAVDITYETRALTGTDGPLGPALGAGVNFSGFATPVINAAGQTAFIGGLAGPGVTSANNTGVWSGGGGAGLAMVAREGNPAPGVASGVNFGGFIDDPAFNAAGQTAFVGSLTGAGVNSDNDTAIWSAGGGSGLALVVREGSQAPGTNAGVRFSSFANLLLNGAGRTAFTGRLTGAGVNSENAVGIWTQGDGSGLTLVARSGSPAPGTPNVVRFHPFPFSRPEFNGVGQVAFTGFLVGTGITTANDVGIWATDRAGQLHLIAREGDLFDVSDDPLNPDLRTLLGVSSTAGAGFSSGGEDGRPAVINDAGQLALFASFTDGSSGIFVATIGGDSTTPFAVTIAPAIAPASGFNFAWNSQPGKFYDLVTSTDLATPVTQWPVHASYGDIPATGTTTTLTAVPADGPQRYFAVVEKDAVP